MDNTKLDNTQQAEFYQDIVRCMPEAVIFADKQGLILTWNPGATALFGFDARDAIGLSLDLIIPENLRKPHWDGYYHALQRGSTVHCGRSRITKALHKTGKLLYVDMSFAVVTQQTGNILGAMAVARDATQRHLADKQLRQQASISVK